MGDGEGTVDSSDGFMLVAEEGQVGEVRKGGKVSKTWCDTNRQWLVLQ